MPCLSEHISGFKKMIKLNIFILKNWIHKERESCYNSLFFVISYFEVYILSTIGKNCKNKTLNPCVFFADNVVK